MINAFDAAGGWNGKLGVLLVNLGTPEAPTKQAVKTYLKEFLSDRRVVEIPPLIWQVILRGIILNVRPKKSAHAYAQIWDQQNNISPLKAITAAQAAQMASAFGESCVVDYAMRYGQPSLASRIDAMKQAGVSRLLIAPLYPQYCGATTASVVDEVGRVLAAMRWQPSVRWLPPYFDAPEHIEALAQSTADSLSKLDFDPDLVIASFHGMPERTRSLGDPYYDQCQTTARLLAGRLNRTVEVTFQSRFGRARWLEPATMETLTALPGRGVKSLAVVAPGFSADCLETLEEVAIRGREAFLDAGGENFAYLPCLNAEADGTKMLQQLLKRELAGWLND